MPATEAKRRANRKYLTEKVAELRIYVEKEEKSLIQDHAKDRNESLNAFVKRAIKETMQSDKSVQI